MSAPQPLSDEMVRSARRKLLNEVAVGRLHLHLRTCRGDCRGRKPAIGMWCVAFYRTALCKTDRCMWVSKKE